jgi:hypothetical protein
MECDEARALTSVYALGIGTPAWKPAFLASILLCVGSVVVAFANLSIISVSSSNTMTSLRLDQPSSTGNLSFSAQQSARYCSKPRKGRSYARTEKELHETLLHRMRGRLAQYNNVRN